MCQHQENNQLFWVWIQSQIQYYQTQGLIQKQSDQLIQNIYELLEIGFIHQMFLDIDQNFFTHQLKKIKNRENKIIDLQKFSKNLIKYSQLINLFLMNQYNKKFMAEYQKLYFNQNLSNQFSKNNMSNKKYSILSPKLQNKQIYKGNQQLQGKNIVAVSKKDQLQASYIQLIKLLFYLVLQSSNQQIQIKSQYAEDSENCVNILNQRKNPQFIQRICQLPQQVQNYLMEQIKIVQTQKIDKIVQLKQLLNDLQGLQEENQYYKEQIQIILNENQRLEKQIQQQVLEQDKVSKQIIKYHQEKQELFQQFQGITCLQQFIQMMENIQKQNELLENTIAELQQKNYQIQKKNAQSIHKINKSAQQITKINEQIGKFRTQIKGLTQDIQFYDQFCNSMSSSLQKNSLNQQDQQEDYILEQSSFVDSIILRENQDIYNSQLKVSGSKNSISHKNSSKRTITENSIKRPNKTHRKCVSYLDQNQQQKNLTDENIKEKRLSNQSKQNLGQTQIIIDQTKQKYRNDLMKKLQNLYKQISDLTTSITQIKEQNRVFDRKNKVNQLKIRDLKILNDAMTKQLKHFM